MEEQAIVYILVSKRGGKEESSPLGMPSLSSRTSWRRRCCNLTNPGTVSVPSNGTEMSKGLFLNMFTPSVITKVQHSGTFAPC